MPQPLGPVRDSSEREVRDGLLFPGFLDGLGLDAALAEQTGGAGETGAFGEIEGVVLLAGGAAGGL